MSDISTVATDALNDFRSEVVLALEGIAGLKVTADPTQVNPPCAVVGVPTIRRVKILRPGSMTAEVDIPVDLVAPPPAQASSINWLLRYVLPVMRLLAASEATPQFSDQFGNQTLPSYLLSVTKTLRIEEDGS